MGFRARILPGVVLLLVGMGGCTMCPDPFDYSGPVPNGSAPQNDFFARSNGILPLRATPDPWPPVVGGPDAEPTQSVLKPAETSTAETSTAEPSTIAETSPTEASPAEGTPDVTEEPVETAEQGVEKVAEIPEESTTTR